MIRKALAAAVGMAQVGIGTSSIVFIYILHHNHWDVQVVFNISMEEISLYILLSLVFGLFSLISGLLFVQEWRSP